MLCDGGSVLVHLSGLEIQLHQDPKVGIKIILFCSTAVFRTQSVLRLVGSKGDGAQALSPRASHSETLQPRQNESPGVELSVTGSQAEQSWLR